MKIVKQGGIITLAIILISISINMFLGAHNVAAGGVSGLGILAEAMFNINRSYVVLVLNILMLGLAFKFLGKDAFIRILAGSILLPIFLYLVPEYQLVNDTILSIIFGSMIFGVGVNMLYKINASSGGTTIPPMIMKKYYNLNPSLGLLFTDLAIVTLNLIVFGTDAFFLAVLSLIITSMIMSYLETAFHQKKVIMLRSNEHLEEIKILLQKELNRGVTMLHVNGGMSDELGKMLMIVLNQQQMQKALDIINKIDKHSFVIIHKVSEVHGLGFTYQNL
ncbi:YitT family protein [Breznakia pachnodae]|uniref:Uncharacterized membrane-anchored protein YitT (DUF2179 family) n=1 Tax=Breznakia pachnodae TaxID=265178 RepID=A0ABU0E598_9FIRM|nr:YitT family protein [Breznakia pachnodae]MDQ0361879.1 uncharacterized membrane-anchored protein YitT (DUF2179 family) [Breznakia pachnodae]